MSVCEVTGGPVEYTLLPGRSPDASPLVFLHEGLGSVALWRRFPQQVVEATGGPTAVIYSRHGHGASGPATMPRPVSYMHHEGLVVLPEVLDRLGLRSPVLIGHSDGASIALIHAAAGNPVDALVLIAPHVFVEDVSVDGIAAARRTYLETDLRDRMARYHDDADATFWGWNDVWLSPEFRAWNIEEGLDRIDCPVLLVQGTADEFGTTRQLDAIESGVHGPVTRLEIPGVGHAPHLAQPEVVTEAIAKLIAGSPAPHPFS
ncbi:MAG TPA: alpha/beta hydrolase [Acidimicrobiales bacterium]|nr:alpha/beta hydrolase [Acidimicrobiales bacterium]